jgi:hypothetical protein
VEMVRGTSGYRWYIKPAANRGTSSVCFAYCNFDEENPTLPFDRDVDKWRVYDGKEFSVQETMVTKLLPEGTPVPEAQLALLAACKERMAVVREELRAEVRGVGLMVCLALSLSTPHFFLIIHVACCVYVHVMSCPCVSCHVYYACVRCEQMAIPPLPGSLTLAGATGSRQHRVNGTFEPTDEEQNGMPVYKKKGDDDTWMELVNGKAGLRWYIKPTKQKGATSSVCYAYRSVQVGNVNLPQNCTEVGWSVYDGNAFGIQTQVSCTLAPEGVACPQRLLDLIEAARSTVTSTIDLPADDNNPPPPSPLPPPPPPLVTSTTSTPITDQTKTNTTEEKDKKGEMNVNVEVNSSEFESESTAEN